MVEVLMLLLNDRGEFSGEEKFAFIPYTSERTLGIFDKRVPVNTREESLKKKNRVLAMWLKILRVFLFIPHC
jgi:hypothetical protein